MYTFVLYNLYTIGPLFVHMFVHMISGSQGVLDGWEAGNCDIHPMEATHNINAENLL